MVTGATFVIQPVRQRQQDRDAAQLARRSIPRARCRGRVPVGGRAGHHGPSARGRAAHHAGRRPGRCGDARGPRPPHVEFNIEGDPRPDLIALVDEVRPDQCTLVPVAPGEITSQAGWRPVRRPPAWTASIASMKARGVRVSVFVDPEEAPIRWAASVGADRIELYTEPFARAFERGVEAARAVVCAVRRRGATGALARAGRQRRPRSRSGQPRDFSSTAASRRGLDRPRHHRPRDLRGPRQGRPASTSPRAGGRPARPDR